MNDLPSYSSVFPLGHRYLEHFFDNVDYDNPISLQEKIDGSQITFQFGEFAYPIIQSKRRTIPVNEEGMFKEAIEEIVRLSTTYSAKKYSGVIFRGEYLQKPHHNQMSYSRVPEHHIIIYDILEPNGLENYFTNMSVQLICNEFGLEYVPAIGIPEIPSKEYLLEQLEKPSILGGMREGIVLKNYRVFGQDKKFLIAKIVRDEFKEKMAHSKKVGKNNVSELFEVYRTDARFNKAIQHLADDGKLKFEPQDIPMLLEELRQDTSLEYEDEVAKKLYKIFERDFHKIISKGFPEYYKNYLMERSLNE